MSAASATLRSTMATSYAEENITRIHAHHIVQKTITSDARGPYIAARAILLDPDVHIDPYQVGPGSTEEQAKALCRQLLQPMYRFTT